MRSFITYAFVITVVSCFLTAIAVPTLVEAQSQSPGWSNANVTGPHKLGVKITSPSKNATVPAGQLIISGISSDTPITNCMVSADWNDPSNQCRTLQQRVVVEQKTIQIGHTLTTRATII